MLNGIIYRLSIVGVLIFINSCGSAPEDDGGFITSSGGDEPVVEDSAVVTELDLTSQPLMVRYFFKFKDYQIGDDYCYDEISAYKTLTESDPDLFGTEIVINDDYLRFENDECFVTTEFKIMSTGETKIGVLLQTSKNGQQAGYYWLDEDGENWNEVESIPLPKMWDFYYSLEDSEQGWVDDFGYYYVYVRETSKQVSFEFSLWQMGLNADGKEIMDFNKEPDFSYDLMHDDNGFWLKKVYENEELKPNRFFMAYSETGEISDDFSYFSDMIGEQLKDYGVESVYADFSQTDYHGYFANDTFDFSSMQQFEPRNGYWFYEKGKEPLDLEYDMVDPTVKKAKRYFDEKY
jgi:hypothetical protein